jgi:hypothetical protein
VPPTERLVPSFAAEPPQDLLPYGRWEGQLSAEFLAACAGVAAPEGGELGEPGALLWYPDRTWHGRTYVPVTAPTSTGLELFGFVSFRPASDGTEPADFRSRADATEETAAANPDWQLDLCDEVIGTWRGENSGAAAMTLVWGTALVPGGAVATAELGGVTVDQCTLTDGRFTLIAPDDYRHDYLEVKLWSERGAELAVESLYAEED